jgi:hypothetical protein
MAYGPARSPRSGSTPCGVGWGLPPPRAASQARGLTAGNVLPFLLSACRGAFGSRCPCFFVVLLGLLFVRLRGGCGSVFGLLGGGGFGLLGGGGRYMAWARDRSVLRLGHHAQTKRGGQQEDCFVHMDFRAELSTLRELIVQVLVRPRAPGPKGPTLRLKPHRFQPAERMEVSDRDAPNPLRGRAGDSGGGLQAMADLNGDNRPDSLIIEPAPGSSLTND